MKYQFNGVLDELLIRWNKPSLLWRSQTV